MPSTWKCPSESVNCAFFPLIVTDAYGSAPPPRTTTRPTMTVVVFSCAGANAGTASRKTSASCLIERDTWGLDRSLRPTHYPTNPPSHDQMTRRLQALVVLAAVAACATPDS